MQKGGLRAVRKCVNEFGAYIPPKTPLAFSEILRLGSVASLRMTQKKKIMKKETPWVSTLEWNSTGGFALCLHRLFTPIVRFWSAPFLRLLAVKRGTAGRSRHRGTRGVVTTPSDGRAAKKRNKKETPWGFLPYNGTAPAALRFVCTVFLHLLCAFGLRP